MKRVHLTILVAAAACSLSAGTFTWKATGRVNDWNWAEAGNFEEGAAPGAGDVVTIPAGVAVFVHKDDAASRALMGNLAQIVPMDAESKLTVETAGADDVLVFGAMMREAMKENDSLGQDSTSYRNGELIKTGLGELKLTNALCSAAYYTRMTIKAGSVRMPYTPNKLTRMFYGHITIDEGAKLIIGTANSQGYNYTQPRGIWGKGMITNECEHAQEMRVQNSTDEDPTSVFEGVIGGLMRFVPYGRVMLTGTNSTMLAEVGTVGSRALHEFGAALNQGTLGFKKLGMKYEPSSIGVGTGYGTDEYGGVLLYLGSGETSDRTLILRYSDVCSWYDAGAIGGLCLTGSFQLNTKNARGELVMTGSNTVPCVFRGILSPTPSKESGEWSFRKRGTGAWRFEMVQPYYCPYRTVAPSYTVEEGSLQFDSLRPADEVCALGLGTNRVELYYGTRDDDAHRSDYNFVLGGTNAAGAFTEGTLEPVAGRDGGISNIFYAVDRPLVLKGDGRLLMNAIDNGLGTLERRFTLRGVRALTPGNHTLTLDGAGTNENTIADIEDGRNDAQVSVVKDGAGTWVLAGTNSFTGDLRVKAGTLVLNRNTTYDWYRLVATRLNGGGQLQIAELGLYDAEGANQAKGITAESKHDFSSLTPGKVADGRASIKTWGLGNIYKLFDGKTDMLRFKMYGEKGFNGTCRLNDTLNGASALENPASWYYIDFRLPAGAHAVTSYDMIAPLDNIDPNVQQSTNGDDRFRNSIRGWQLLGSTDGIHWDNLHEVTDAADSANAMHYHEAGKTNYWLAARTAFNASEKTHSGGQAIASARVAFAAPEQAQVRVDPGARLEVRGAPLTIRHFAMGPQGAGTIKNAAFAETGTFAIDDLDLSAGAVTLAGTYENVTGFANLAKWTPVLGGVPAGRYVVAVQGEQLVVGKRGLVILVR